MNDLDYIERKYLENKIVVVNENETIANTYIENSNDELKASKIMIKTKLFPQSITHSYYSMYLSTQSLLFLCGIKCEDSKASIIILKEIFEININNIKKVRDERIQVQYYRKADIDEKQANSLMQIAEDFLIEIKNFSNDLNKENKQKYKLKLKLLLQKQNE